MGLHLDQHFRVKGQGIGRIHCQDAIEESRVAVALA